MTKGLRQEPAQNLKPAQSWGFLPLVCLAFFAISCGVGLYVVLAVLPGPQRADLREMWHTLTLIGAGVYLAGLALTMPRASGPRKWLLAAGLALVALTVFLLFYRPDPSLLGVDEYKRLDWLSGSLAAATAALTALAMTALAVQKALPLWGKLACVMFAAGIVFLLLGFEVFYIPCRWFNTVITMEIGYVRVAARSYQRWLPAGAFALLLGCWWPLTARERAH